MAKSIYKIFTKFFNFFFLILFLTKYNDKIQYHNREISRLKVQTLEFKRLVK